MDSFFCNNKTASSVGGAGTAYPSGAPVFTSDFQ